MKKPFNKEDHNENEINNSDGLLDKTINFSNNKIGFNTKKEQA